MAKTINTHILSALAVCLLGCTAMTGTAQAGWFDSGSSKSDTAKTDTKTSVIDGTSKTPAPAADLDTSIRQAQMLRVSGDYDGAIKHLSQLMLVAADDGRVVSEYGKTLAAQGRAQEAVNFLSRAQQLQGNDWTVYNALGVAYDELSKQDEARAAYEHALTLKPAEATILNNYALSRMLAKDPDGARALMARAQNAGGLSDPKIARNIALVDKLFIAGETPATASAAPAPVHVAMAAPAPAPRTPVVTAPMPVATAPMPRVAQGQPFVNVPAPPAPSSAPRNLQPANTGVIQAQPQMMVASAQPQGVMMQRVPEDPLAGPVISPRPVKAAARPVVKADAAKPAEAAPKAVAKNDAKHASAAEDLQAKADAIAKTLNGKPAAIAQAKAEAEKPAPVVPGRMPISSAPKAVAKADVPKPADAKTVPVKAVVKKDAIPALRLSANAY